MKTIVRLFSVFLLLALLLAGQGIRPAVAAGYTVNTLDDVDDGTCDGTHCSLREAINTANASNADDTITFSVSGTITLGSNLPNIADAATAGALTIDGGGNITLSGNNSVRVMIVDFGANLTLQNLTIANGSADYGGGIFNFGTLNVTDATFSGNSAEAGGGIYNYPGGTLEVTDSTFSDNNSTSADGGGIWNNASLTVTGSMFSNNNSVAGGGGIYNYPDGTLDVTHSTFSGNSAAWGGGIDNSGTLTVTNSTFSGNSADYGGGIENYDGTLSVTNATFSGNSASTQGGGIYQTGGTATLKNTLIANSPSGGDCVGSLSGTNNNNLIEDSANACGLTNGVDGNIIGSDPKLGALTGSPAYFPLNAGSLAIDAGDNATCAAPPVNNQSQNGVTRPQDGDGNGTAVCDIGSYELQTGQQIFYSVGTQDGWILESSETSNVGGMMNSTASTFNLGDDAKNRQYRVILSFNTSALPDNAVITRVTLQIKKQGLVGRNPFTILGGLKVDIQKPYFGTAAALAPSDFQAAADKNGVATFNAMPLGNWYSAVLNASGLVYINKTGTTQFRLRFATDDNNNRAADYMRFFSGNYGTVSDRPTLIVEYYVP
jgi:CSLREA domain-containing protein